MTYRIKEIEFANGNIIYRIEKQSVADQKQWWWVTERDTLEDARLVISFLKGNSIKNERVVE